MVRVDTRDSSQGPTSSRAAGHSNRRYRPWFTVAMRYRRGRRHACARRRRVVWVGGALVSIVMGLDQHRAQISDE
jgi:hypothetical protein